MCNMLSHNWKRQWLDILFPTLGKGTMAMGQWTALKQVLPKEQLKSTMT